MINPRVMGRKKQAQRPLTPPKAISTGVGPRVSALDFVVVFCLTFLLEESFLQKLFKT